MLGAALQVVRQRLSAQLLGGTEAGQTLRLVAPLPAPAFISVASRAFSGFL